MTLIGWVFTLLVVVSYAAIGRYGVRQFHIANAVAFVPMAVVNVSAGVWSAAALNVVFGLAALWGLRRG